MIKKHRKLLILLFIAGFFSFAILGFTEAGSQADTIQTVTETTSLEENVSAVSDFKS